ncbi:uncharacterized protein CIMG_03446 [Coccidioides immitis RS]|uniref:Uncharacterized protein n=1 Tax=Coccidioides immitis (strain RS) TaxID=246410 RepID=J3KBD6_COCIM|nr:uncharacterized protein CIMG_03446 [Coccidioides immitis RS]EAS32422.3 hypothetical protein CIMG_03446 [Coccidioides immitis RS]TPX19550.1 hypothetical protein DIZ76_017342 [Coccidioides immitis]
MCRLLFSTYSDGPAMVLSPPYLHNADNILANNPTSVPPSRPQFPNPGSVSTSVNGIQSGPPRSSISRSGLSMSGSSSTPLSANPSRKRSHDEFNASNDDDASKPSTAQQPPFRSQTPEEPIYGEGMVLLNPRTGLALSAESQTGTWFEEKAEAEASAAPPVAVASGSGQPGLPSRKSQRLDSSASGWDDIAAASIHRKLQSSSHNDTYRNISSAGSTSTSTSGPQTPLVDDATRLLGISWQRVSTEDKDMAAAVRGWERYINNHFAPFLQNAQILLKHRGLNAYLVTANPVNNYGMAICDMPMNGFSSSANQPCFYLFTEDLTEGQLVGKNWESCLHNLQSTPIAFEAGSEVMRAAERTPERLLGDQGILNGTIYMNGNGIKMGNEGMEMAMEIDR